MNFFDHKNLGNTSCSYALKSWNALYNLQAVREEGAAVCQNDTSSLPRRLHFSATPLWEPLISKQTKKSDPISETFVLFGILDDEQNLEIWQHHVIFWHPDPLELVSAVCINKIYSLRRLKFVTGGCLRMKTAYCAFDESNGWYFLEDTNSHHTPLYLEVKLCFLPFYHPRVCIVKYSTSSVIPYSPWSFLPPPRENNSVILLQLILLVLSFFVLYGLIGELYPSTMLHSLVLFSVSIFCISDCLYVLIFLLFSLTGVFSYPRHNWNFCFSLSHHLPTLVTAALTGLLCFPF